MFVTNFYQFPQVGPIGPPTTGMMARWRADLGVSESGGSVSAWADQSGNGYDLISGTNPTLVTNSINGHPSIEFQGNITNAYMTCSGFTLAQPLSVFMVTQPVLFGGEMSAFNNIIGSNNNDLQFLYNRNGSSDLGEGIYNYYAGSGFNSVPFYASKDNWYSTVYAIDNTNSKVYVDGVDREPGNWGTLGFNNIVVGRYMSSGQYFKGRIAEMIIYDHTLNTDERNAIMAYVLDHYGI